MTERLPYEEQLAQQLQQLPLPDENKAWEDMKRRLEEDDDDGVVLPWWRRGCGLWVALLLLLLAGGVGLLWKRDYTSGNKEETGKQTGIHIDSKKSGSHSLNKQQLPVYPADSTPLIAADSITASGLISIDSAINNRVLPTHSSTSTSDLSRQPSSSTGNKTNEAGTAQVDIQVNNPGIAGRPKPKTKSTNKLTHTRPDKTGITTTTPAIKKKTGTSPADTQQVVTATLSPSIHSNIAPSAVKPDTISEKNSDSSQQKKTAKAAPPEIDTIPQKKKTTTADSSRVKKKYYFAAGIGLQQLVPIDGQTGVPYSASGRKGTLGDYIPSVYARFVRKDKWFIQGEFKYGAPQSVKELTYSSATRIDTNPQGLDVRVITARHLKKTYYHQLPFSFHYYPVRGLSVGAGVVWNKFVSAIYEENENRFTFVTQYDTTISQIKKADRDTNGGEFAASYFQGMAELQYQWRRFTAGARYSFGLQPYITYTIANQPQRNERNKALVLLLRYEIWRSKSGRNK